MAPTIRDVARAAGVSIATVSHALSGKRPVSRATRRKIHTAAERLGYRPNQVAAAMITGRTMTLGVLVPDIANPFFGELVSAAERAAAARGYTVVVCSSELDPELEARYVQTLADRRVDALVYLGGTPRRNDALQDVDVPFVAVDEALSWLPKTVSVVASDSEHGGRLAAEHLLELGHTELGVITGQRGLPTAKARLDGFRRVTDVPRARVRWADYTLDGGRTAARDLLQAEPELTGLFCANDLMALGALEVARELGRNLPDDLAVVGFDDIFVSALVTPPLTTIRQPLSRLGEEAAQLAIDLIEGQTAGPERRTLPVELVIRGSTAKGAARARVLAAVDD